MGVVRLARKDMPKPSTHLLVEAAPPILFSHHRCGFIARQAAAVSQGATACYLATMIRQWQEGGTHARYDYIRWRTTLWKPRCQLSILLRHGNVRMRSDRTVVVLWIHNLLGNSSKLEVHCLLPASYDPATRRCNAHSPSYTTQSPCREFITD